jgi:SpoIVB peptidase S55
MRYRFFLVLAALLLPAWPAASAQKTTQYFPLSQVHAGLKGVGRTIFQGNKIEEFQVEILGVLKNALAPKQDVILAKLSGGPLAETGVIAGMSGSPVYVDGKLLGAVALSFPFAKEPVTGITPIQQMLDVVPQSSHGEAEATAGFEPPFKIASVGSGPNAVVRLIPQSQDGTLAELEKILPPEGESSSMTGLRLPLRFGGFSDQAVDAFAPLFRRIGFLPMQGGSISSDENMTASKEGPQPGSMISLMLVRGDLDLNVDCTVTLRLGKDLFACGHRFLLAGPAEIPFAEARVLTTVPNLASSFKIDVPGPLVGAIRQDRFGAIFGVVGETAPTIPVHLRVNSTLGRTENYQFSIVQHPYLSPVLLNLGIVSALSATERVVGPTALDIKGSIQLSDGESVRLDDLISGDMNTANIAGAALSTPLTYLLGGHFPALEIRGIDLTIKSSDELRTATVEQAWSTQSEVRPGDGLAVIALLRTPSGKSVIQKIPIKIPENVSGKELTLVVGSGSSMNAIQNLLLPMMTSSLDLHQLVRALNKMRRDNRLYALLMTPQRSVTMQGDEYPSPPPSLLQTFLSDPAVSSSTAFKATSIAGDFQTNPLSYSIRGERTLRLKVKIPGE